MSIDTLGNFCSIIANGVMASKSFVLVPYSRVQNEIATILKHEGFVKDVQLIEGESLADKKIKIVLKYVGGESSIHEIKRVSKPSRRKYSGIKELPPVIGGLGVSILSTHRGIITNQKAKQLNVGGEVLCTIW